MSDWALIKVTGADRVSFFQGQVTNDLSLLLEKQGQITARLSRSGRLNSFFFIAKLSTHLLIFCPQELVVSIKNDFEKFIIMDDVMLEILETPLWIQFNHFLHDNQNADFAFDFNFYGLNARLVFYEDLALDKTDENEIEEIRVLNGWPKWGRDINETKFINESYLNEISISYKKGCFLGQETAAKIENNRGAAYFPVLLKLQEKIDSSLVLNREFSIGGAKGGVIHYQVNEILQADLFRDFRVNERQLVLEIGEQRFNATVVMLPFYKSIYREDISEELYHLGVVAFQKGESENAKNFLKRALEFHSGLADAYESLGVILGREEKFEEAISWMDKLLVVQPQSVMAHTNKSLYLMRLGKIEEAEAEKSLATVKSFAMFGEEAKLKKQLELEKRKKEEDLLRREKMFLQVLEIDEEDTVALYGMSDIYFLRKEYFKTIQNLEKVLKVNPKYSSAYLLLGKAYEATNNQLMAKETYQTGIVIASKLGDMMPANEMQSRLNQLIVFSSLS